MTSKEALEWMYENIDCDYCPMISICNSKIKWKCVECKEIIEKDIDKLEKSEKVIEILKDYLMIKVSINRNNEYCLDACDYAIPNLDKEQYDLLKEYLDD